MDKHSKPPRAFPVTLRELARVWMPVLYYAQTND